jgi:hypothetical protein
VRFTLALQLPSRVSDCDHNPFFVSCEFGLDSGIGVEETITPNLV